MDKKNITRRKFIRNTAGAAAAISVGTGMGFAGAPPKGFNPRGLPTRKFGKTGIEIPIMIIGTGSRFMSVKDTDKGFAILEHALDNGLFFWDTASIYKNDQEASEERLGKFLQTRRNEVFLASKAEERDAEGAKRTIEQSLKRLQTDYIDLYHVHSIKSMDDVDRIGKDDGVLPLLKDYQRQGIIKHVGFSGHTSSAAMKKAAESYDFDAMLIAMNHARKGAQEFEEEAIPAAGKKDMGVMAMKVFRPRESVAGLDPSELLRYALTLPHITSAVVGTDSIEILNKNLDTIREFKPLPQDKMEELNMALTPFYQHKNVAWMQPGYHDGMMA